jgi:HPt (histidine-containing phosphotransfer) domain-containing protein
MSGNGAVVCWTRVNELRDEIGPEDFEEVVVVFLEEAETMVAELAAAPPEALEEALHALKGTALNLGLSELAALCQDGEARAASGQAAAVPVTPVLTAYARARAALVEGLAQGRAA